MFSRIYLASQSPRRRELLTQIGVPFDVFVPKNVDETPHAGEDSEQYVERVCRDKVVAAIQQIQAQGLPDYPVLAADTTVTLDGQIFGKPENATHAAQMLRQLSGQTHQVLTAIALAQAQHIEIAISRSSVRFEVLDEARIQRYLATQEFQDKAGGYAVQGIAAAFIEHLSGSYSGVMGLPLFETAQLLQNFNYPVP